MRQTIGWGLVAGALVVAVANVPLALAVGLVGIVLAR